MQPGTFGVGDPAKQFDLVTFLPGRIMVGGLVAMGALLVAAGGTFAVDGFLDGLTTVLVLLGMGLAIVAFGLYYLPRGSRAVSEFRVTSEGVDLIRMDGRRFEVRWSDYRNPVVIVDARAVPIEKRIANLRSVEFVFNAVNLPAQGPIPREAVYAIMGSARSHGMNVQGWVESPTGPGPERDIKIVA